MRKTIASVPAPAAPLSEAWIHVTPGQEKDGMVSVIVVTTDTATGRLVSEEQIVLSRRFADVPEAAPLPAWCALRDGRPLAKVYLTIPAEFVGYLVYSKGLTRRRQPR